MYIHGSTINQKGNTITVHIVTNADRTEQKEIGEETAGLFFTTDPVSIESAVNDTFDHLLCQSATIRLLVNDFISDFFCTSCRDAIVNIYRDNVCLFAGFIEPQAYSQPYNEIYDEIELSCIDALSALQYSKYKNVGSLGVLYNAVKADAGQRTFHDIVLEILDGITQNLSIADSRTSVYLYDGSKAIDNAAANKFTIFKQLSISDLLFLGDAEDDVWQQDDVLEEILKYLNLHIIQNGLTFYIFSWETIKADANTMFCDLRNGYVGPSNLTDRKQITIETVIAADCDTRIDVGEVYNQLLLTCDVKEIENVIESPLDDDLLTSPYANKQKYCTEYSSDGEGERAYNAFYAMTHNEKTTYDAGTITNWFIQLMSNQQWTFPKNGVIGSDLYKEFITEYQGEKLYQHKLPDWLGTNPGAAIIAIGSTQMKTAKDDNSPVSKVNMTNFLVVSVNGNGVDKEGEYYPDAKDIKKNIPYAIYNGNSAGGTFSPADTATTNYIVLSGSVVLNPLMEMTNTYYNLNKREWTRFPFPDDGKIHVWHRTVPSRDNGDGRYYTRQYFEATRPNDDAYWSSSNPTNYGLVPFTGKGPEWYEFKYSAIGDGTDTVSKVAVLSCMLIIGDKCVVETGTQGQTSDFTWKKYKKLEECANEDEYYQQSFTIGFDPKIGDKLIGTEFRFQNNISYTMGIDAEGIAIPIKKGDAVSGKVQFMILGPVNTIWDEITRRHPTFFRHTKWGKNSIPLLAHTSNIMIKEFEVKVYSDNGLLNNTGDNDIVYMSDTQENFKNTKDDIEFKINSALTAAECKELGVTNTVKLSTPYNVDTHEAVLSIYDYTKGEQAKPEQLYVDSYYKEYHLPRVQMEQNLDDVNGIIGIFNHYTHPALGKTFFVQGIDRNLMGGSALLKLKEIGNDWR